MSFPSRCAEIFFNRTADKKSNDYLEPTNMTVIRLKLILDDQAILRIAKHLHPNDFGDEYGTFSILYCGLKAIRVLHLPPGKTDVRVKIEADYTTVKRYSRRGRSKGYEETQRVKPQRTITELAIVNRDDIRAGFLEVISEMVRTCSSCGSTPATGSSGRCSGTCCGVTTSTWYSWTK